MDCIKCVCYDESTDTCFYGGKTGCIYLEDKNLPGDNYDDEL